MRVLSLVTDAFGGRGGIAAYNRSLLQALCTHRDVEQVVALPRLVTYDLEPMPYNLCYESGAVGSKLRFAKGVAKLAASTKSCALVVCGHLHLLPFAHLLGLRFGCPVLPTIYGIEAWSPTRKPSVNRILPAHQVFRFDPQADRGSI